MSAPTQMTPIYLFCYYLTCVHPCNICNSIFQCIPESKLEHILVAHALSGCDTTSGFFGIGKCKLLKSSILEDKPQLACTLLNTDSSPADIIKAGEAIIKKLCGKQKKYVSYKKNLHSNTKKTKFDPRRLHLPQAFIASGRIIRTKSGREMSQIHQNTFFPCERQTRSCNFQVGPDIPT